MFTLRNGFDESVAYFIFKINLLTEILQKFYLTFGGGETTIDGEKRR